MKMSDYFALPVLHDVYAQDEHAPVYAADCNRVVFKGWNEPAIELACMAINNHDRLTEENAKLRELLSDIMECVNQDLWDTRCDDAKQLLNQLRGQNNDNMV